MDNTASSKERQYQTLGRGLDHRLPPMRLWKKAKKFGIWDPQSIDLTVDREHWLAFSPLEKEVLLHLTSLFQAGEESVTLDLLPLMMVIARERRLEEEMYLTSFLWEEAKHVEAFRRFLDEVTGEHSDLSRFEGPSYKQLFHHELPTALGRLEADDSPIAQAETSVTYNLIVEGVLAETGYYGYQQMLAKNGLMPGMQQVIGHLRADESRHLAYGVYLLSRLTAEHGQPVWKAIEHRMSHLLPIALGVVQEMFAPYETLPFGLRMETFLDFAMGQFQRRIERVEKAQRQTLDEVNRLDVEEAA